jgi:hypothetical protein
VAVQGPDPWAPPDRRPTASPASHDAGWYAPPSAVRQPRRGRRAVTALATVVLLLGGGLGAAILLEGQRAERVQAQVDAVLPALQGFVEQARGLPFEEPVEVEVLDDEAFLDALYEEPADAPGEREDRDGERTLKALGLIEPDADLDEQVQDQLDAGVVGFYDPSTDRLAVRGRDLDVFTELVLVHELTHALQDQHFDLERPDLDEADDERSLAFDSLVEGDAVRVEDAWLAAQPADRRAEVLDRLGGAQERELGTGTVQALLSFPYVAGPSYVRQVLDRGGRAALDAAYATPPTTSEQVLQPGAGPPAEVARPEVQGAVVDEGVLGEVGLALVLGVDPWHPGPHSAWGGDRYVTVEDGDRTCTTADVAADEPDQRPGLRQALAAARPDAELTDGPGGTLRLVACVS